MQESCLCVSNQTGMAIKNQQFAWWMKLYINTIDKDKKLENGGKTGIPRWQYQTASKLA